MGTDLTAVDGVSYPWADYPAPGGALEVADGIFWISTPVPFVGLRQVNVWLLRDGAGWTMIDCGFGWPQTHDLLAHVWADLLQGRLITRLIVTHYHPDHAGNMAWITRQWGDILPVMSLGEWFAANISMSAGYADNIKQRTEFHIQHGLDEARQQLFKKEVIPYDVGVRLPPAFRRVREHNIVTIGADRWRVVTGQGHSPEHVSLYCAERKILIAGDQILPQITTNVSTWPMEPEADTLLSFLETCRKFIGLLDADTLVLPSHRKPFRNVHYRLRELARHHAARLNLMLDGVAEGEATTAGRMIDVLFKGNLDGHQIGFAMGEVVAHLNYLVSIGRMTRVPTGDKNWRYAKVPGFTKPVAPLFT
jgi:glyoxylase-like metal-dependent hydrolase (beta-lactamase superfamily II)